MSRHVYWAYGLSIETNMACPELPLHPLPAPEPDVSVRLLADTRNSLRPSPDYGFEVLPGRFRLDVPDVARYSVEGGKRIVIEPFPDSDPERVRLFLMGSAMGALLYQRGLFPLHGSAIETPMGAIIFTGGQGSGKSTLAAEFHRHGYRLLSDDICAVERTPKGLRVLPALAQLRLCADAYTRLGEPSTARFVVDKFVVPMGESYCPDPAPLRAIHILSDQDASVPRLDVLHGFDRLRYLMENLYRPQFLKGQRTQGDVMHTAGTIAKEVLVAVLSRRRDETATANVVEFLHSAWAECFGTTSSGEKN